MAATIIFWPLLLVGVVTVCLSWIRMRERIPFSMRDKIEKITTMILILILMVDIFMIAFERKEISQEVNDCIRFYRYFPGFYNDSEFHFIKDLCYNYFEPVEIDQLRKSGHAWRELQMNKGFDPNNLGNITFINNFSDLQLNQSGGNLNG
ncbi:MAG TPA: hypothetical protein ENH99_02785 [Candidatus Pacearchaeota archaeon]|uniref:Uncharacterized protein n=1 Tax=marine sediment metagenome TaxID=412755 RepID=A0A0F9BXT6_9ZZZZ|nr:hypothetical protein [Candidatus Pacearchaeota archaeon]